MHKLWTEAYRPSTLDAYVWADETMRATIEAWLKDGVLPNILFSGTQGTGKTSMCKLLLKQLDIPDTDILYINGSRERRVEGFQERVIGFVGAWAMGPTGMKYIILDEAERLSPHSQDLLKAEIEINNDVCRWLVTCNQPRLIIPPLRSRLQELHFLKLDNDNFVVRVADILDAEKIQYEVDDLLAYVNFSYPDLRKCINLLQQNCQNGVLLPRSTTGNDSDTKEYLLLIRDLFKSGNLLDGRKLILEQLRLDEYEDFYRLLYKNLAIFGNSPSLQEDALIIIRDALLHHAIIADAEINLSACLLELGRLSREP